MSISEENRLTVPVDRDAEKGSESDPVPGLRKLLGNDVVLIPVRRGSKRPIPERWQNLGIERMADERYLQAFRGENVGVLLGKGSGGLCAIDIDSDAWVEPFLKLNPQLRNTLTTKGKRGVQIWVRIAGEYPAAKKIQNDEKQPVGEWRADGNQSVIHGDHPEGGRYTRLKAVPPIRIRFEEIQWPADWVLPWVKSEYDRLVKEHGLAYEVGRRGVQLNEYFFVERFRLEHPVLWEPNEQEFYEYQKENGLWVPVSSDALAHQFGIDLKRAGDEVGEPHFVMKRTGPLMHSYVQTLRGFVEKRDAFEREEGLVHVANGVLDLRPEFPKLMSFHPDYRSRNICPIAFDPEAECPRFVSELLGTALNEEDVDLLQRWAGSVLLGRNTAQRILLLMGTPNGGKSTLIEVIETIIGIQNVAQIRTKHLHKQFEFYKFIGKTLLTGKDVSAKFLSEEGAEHLKALVGNDLLDAEKKGSSAHFQLRGRFNVAITSNSDLRIKLEGDTGAWSRRMLVIDYNRPAPKRRYPDFGRKLIQGEGSGILNWIIEGAIKHLAELEARGDFQLTVAQEQRIRRLIEQSDSVRLFVEQRVCPAKGENVTMQELEEAYVAYCGLMGWKAALKVDFSRAIISTMQEVHRVTPSNDIERGFSSRRGFRGHSLKKGGK